MAQRLDESAFAQQAAPREALLLCAAGLLLDGKAPWRIAGAGIPLRLAQRGGGVTESVADAGDGAGIWHLSGECVGELHAERHGERVRGTFAGTPLSGTVTHRDGETIVHLDGRAYAFTFAPPPAVSSATGGHGGAGGDGRVTAPMPGKIVKVAVREGEAVEERALLIVLEAMKMEHRIEAPAGAIRQKRTRKGRRDRRRRRAARRTGMSRLPKSVTLFEMGARDGLQNESELVPPDDKVRYIDLLSETGLRWIEATSFVSPKAIPQLADAADVFTRIRKKPGVRYPVLVPNLKGYQRAKDAGADAIAVFTAASERFTLRNINMTIDESLEAFRDVVRAAKSDGMWVRGYVSTAFGSPFGDAVTPHAVVDVSVKLMEMGCDSLSIGDTIGVGVPSQVDELVPLLADRIPLERIAMHFHDTRGTALANVYASLQNGVASFDSSAGGLGGCPYAPGATGNVGTEDVLYLLNQMGIETGVDRRQSSRRFALHLRHRRPRADEQSVPSDGIRRYGVIEYTKP